MTCLLLLGRKPAGTSEILIDENIESKSDPYHANVTSVSRYRKERERSPHVPLSLYTIEPGATNALLFQSLLLRGLKLGGTVKAKIVE